MSVSEGPAEVHRKDDYVRVLALAHGSVRDDGVLDIGAMIVFLENVLSIQMESGLS
jgi:hypothetical protein